MPAFSNLPLKVPPYLTLTNVTENRDLRVVRVAHKWGDWHKQGGE